jgi:hypothetical protein
MSGYELSILYIRILSHRTGAVRNFGECGFYVVGRIDAATKKRPQSRENLRRRPQRRRRGHSPVPLLEGRMAHAGRGGGECSEDDDS